MIDLDFFGFGPGHHLRATQSSNPRIQIAKCPVEQINLPDPTTLFAILKGMVKQVGGMNYIRLKETPAEYQAV